MAPTVFIDGEAGTTGLQIRDRLSGRTDVSLLHLDDSVRKDMAARKDALNACDLAVLCLPDAAAREAVALIDNNKVKVIDASTAHRTADGWVYGFPELDSDQSALIAEAGR
ncbi:MAG: N-acetyl-gamma-glutamyl-phosphate reductase, partial [Rhodospirillaceae bacterium]|nr:N-acetyl-gamma-glutamyl-phosphate reductase [Rhodospirillaceae bacterium]